MITEWGRKLFGGIRKHLKLQLLAVAVLCLAFSCALFFFFRFAVETWRLARYEPEAAQAKLARLALDFQDFVSREKLSSGDVGPVERRARESKTTLLVGDDSAGPMAIRADGPVLTLSSIVHWRDGDGPVRFLYQPVGPLHLASRQIAMVLVFDVFLILLFFTLKKKFDYIQKIERSLVVLESGDLGHAVPVEGADELARLAESVNLLSRSIRERTASEQKALQANREIIGDLSHDIRTPLTVGMGYLELLLREEGLSDEERRDYLRLALKKAEQIKERTGALLEYATLASGQLSARRTAVDVRTMTAQLKQELTALAELRVSDGLPAGTAIRGDIGLLERLFDNLLSNLRKHGDLDRPVDFRTRLRDGNVELEIENAIGRPAPESKNRDSTSLGLRICACILELHDGRFETERTEATYRTRIIIPVNVS